MHIRRKCTVGKHIIGAPKMREKKNGTLQLYIFLPTKAIVVALKEETKKCYCLLY